MKDDRHRRDSREEDWDRVPPKRGRSQRPEYDRDDGPRRSEYGRDDRPRRPDYDRDDRSRRPDYEEEPRRRRDYDDEPPRRPRGDAPHRKRKKHKRKKTNGFLKFIYFLLFVAVIFLCAAYVVEGKIYEKMKYEKVDSLVKAPVKEDGVVNILLIGNDSRENAEDGRSDAMILLSISSKTKKVYMTSLLRDMYVEIPGHDGNRLNAAYAYGGPELLMKTIEKNLGVSVNRYVLVNFEAFANLVDGVNGVDLELTNKEVEYVNGYLVEYNMLLNRPQGTDNLDPTLSGMVHLNGAQALAYSRNRLIGTDFGRTERQRKILGEVFRKLPSALINNPTELADGILPNLTTNLTRNECFWLSLEMSKLMIYDMEQCSIPMEGTYKDSTIRGMAVLEVDFKKNKKYIDENIYGK